MGTISFFWNVSCSSKVSVPCLLTKDSNLYFFYIVVDSPYIEGGKFEGHRHVAISAGSAISITSTDVPQQ